MKKSNLLSSAAILACAIPVLAQSIEPKAGTWKTWIISSGKDYRVPPPPDAAATAGELRWVREVAAEPNPGIADSVTFWSAGAPSYRWIELINNRGLIGAPLTPYVHRVYTYVALAMYDATIAAWDSKYAYNRPRPSELDPTLKTRLPAPHSPSYPSEHAATAAAAAGVLAYFFPNEAASFESLSEEAGQIAAIRRSPVSVRLLRRVGIRQEGGRPRHRRCQSGRLGRGVDRHGSDGQVHVGGDQSCQRDCYHMEAFPPVIAK